MLLIICVLLAIIPLLGIVWILVQGSITTVDGLFMTLILLAMSAILGMHAALELRKRRATAGPHTSAARAAGHLTTAGGKITWGKVESVQFFESHVGQPNKSIVTLSDGSQSSRMLVLEGDLRNALPVGKKVEVTYRETDGRRILLNVNYA